MSMDAFLIFVDDWLASPSVDDMDAAEERGYLRLLLHCAKAETCGLEFDPKVLANRSKLGDQWNKETVDPNLRFGTTSGEKLLQKVLRHSGWCASECTDKDPPEDQPGPS